MQALPEGKRRRPEAAGRQCPAGPRRYRAECPFDSMRKRNGMRKREIQVEPRTFYKKLALSRFRLGAFLHLSQVLNVDK